MRKAILVKFIQVILAALALSSAIFYIATSSSLLRNSREDMMYTLQMLDSVLDYSGDFQAQIQKLESTITSHEGRFTIIDSQGTVVCDTGVDTATMDNHLDRQEVRDALSEGSGYSTRYSNTLEKTLLYVAVKSANSDYVLRMSVPYAGSSENFLLLLPAVWLSFLVALVYSAFAADSFAESITKPLQEISQEMLKVKGDYTDLKFETYQYPEINIIAETTTKMSQNVKEYLNQIEAEKKIRQEFFSNASHELKTPITSVKGYAELLESGIIQDEKQKMDFVRRIEKEADNMTNLINDILMISRLEAKEAEVVMTDVAMDVVANEVMESMKPLSVSRQVMLHCQCEPVSLRANGQQMKELLGNLVSNAIKYNKPGGQVWIHIDKMENYMVIRVRDNGVGIPRESLGRIFERFYRVDKGRNKKQGGTGLGLSIVKHIVNFYHGTIDVRSKLDQGTEFTVKIPI